MRYDARRASSTKRFVADEATRRANRARLAAIGERILRAVPGCALASDQLYREADLAIDYCEDVPPLPRAAVERIVALMEAEGLTAQSQLDPRQRLVRRLRQAGDDANAAARSSSASTSMPSASDSCSPAIRRTMRRCSRSFRTRSASPTCARFADRIATPPKYVTRARRARASPSSRISCWPHADAGFPSLNRPFCGRQMTRGGSQCDPPAKRPKPTDAMAKWRQRALTITMFSASAPQPLLCRLEVRSGCVTALVGTRVRYGICVRHPRHHRGRRGLST